MSKHQELMNVAYARFEGHKEWSKKDFWNQLGDTERLAVFAGNLNYQVDNGGFQQWHYNGYSAQATWLLEHLPKFGPISIKVANLIFDAMVAIEDWKPDVEEWVADEWEDEDGHFHQDGYYEMVPNEEEPYVDQLDEPYYALQDEFLAEVETVLQKDEAEIMLILARPQPANIYIRKPIVRGPLDGNIFAVMGAAQSALEAANQKDQVAVMVEQVTAVSNYSMALAVIMDYVDIRL